ncbi:MAG: hypothetical protein ACJAQ1_001004 [Flavobacterium sp.]
MVLTTTADNEQNSTEYKSTANAFLIGGKTRITAAIPWVAPSIEIGIGASGSFQTVAPFTNINESGLFLHIPFSIGPEFGPKHNFDIASTYYLHKSLEQFVGAIAFGVSFPLDNE